MGHKTVTDLSTRLAGSLPPEVIPRGKDPDVDALAALVSALKASGVLATELAAIRDDATEADDLAGRSSFHELGFVKIELGRLPIPSTEGWNSSECAVSLRLHVWTAAQRRRVQRDPHAHRWRFASTVLWGGPLEVSHFDERAGGSAYFRFEYNSAREPMPRTGPTSLMKTRTDTLRSDDLQAYTCERGAVHTIRPAVSGSLTTTLIAQGGDAVDTAPVYRVDDDGNIDDLLRPSGAEIRTLLGDVLRAC